MRSLWDANGSHDQKGSSLQKPGAASWASRSRRIKQPAMSLLTVTPSGRSQRRDNHSTTFAATGSNTRIGRQNVGPPLTLKRGMTKSEPVSIVRRNESTKDTVHRIERLLQQRLGDIDAKLEKLTTEVTRLFPSTPQPSMTKSIEELPTPPLPCEPVCMHDEQAHAQQSDASSRKVADRQYSSEIETNDVDELELPPHLQRVDSTTLWRDNGGRNKKQRSACRARIHTFLEEPSSSCVATIYSRVMILFILVSVCMPLLQTLKKPFLSDVDSLMVEMSLDLIFVIEVIVRWLSYPSFVKFFWVPYNFLDLCVMGPLVLRTFLYLGVVMDGLFSQTVLFCIVPVLRLLKALRTFPNLKLVYYALSIAGEALTLPLSLMLVLTLVFSSLFFLVEPRENIETMPHAMWFVIVTVTTVGYGDVSPETIPGKLIASVLSVSGVLYMAMPLTIVGGAFDYTWKNRDPLIYGGLMQQRMCQWGLSEVDLDLMFRHFDDDDSGELGVTEFTAMLEEMQLGLSTRSCLQIFKAFDRDGSGSVKFGELARWIFPGIIVEET